MSSATGIHAHLTRKLGRRPPKNAPALRLTDIRTGVIPAHPLSADHLGTFAFGLYQNDQFGVCGPTSVANSRRLLRAAIDPSIAVPSQDDVFDLYRRSGNPRFDPTTGVDDNGVDMQTMLEAAVVGGFGGVKPVAFAKVDVTNDDELEAAVAIFGGVLWGVDLETAQQAQTNQGTWDYKRSGEWGGHAILAGAYAADRQTVITWAQKVATTDAFRRHQLEECWVVVWPENLGTRQFEEGVDIDALGSAYQDLTGRTLPTPVPVPAPQPVPADPDVLLWSRTKDWAAARHTGGNKLAATALAAWAKAKGLA